MYNAYIISKSVSHWLYSLSILLFKRMCPSIVNPPLYCSCLPWSSLRIKEVVSVTTCSDTYAVLWWFFQTRWQVSHGDRYWELWIYCVYTLPCISSPNITCSKWRFHWDSVCSDFGRLLHLSCLIQHFWVGNWCWHFFGARLAGLSPRAFSWTGHAWVTLPFCTLLCLIFRNWPLNCWF